MNVTKELVCGCFLNTVCVLCVSQSSEEIASPCWQKPGAYETSSSRCMTRVFFASLGNQTGDLKLAF